MTRKVLVGGVAAAGAVMLGVAGVALASGDRETTAATVDLSSTVDGSGSGDAQGTAPDGASGDGAGADSSGDAGSGSDAAPEGGESVDAVPAGITSERAQEIAVQAQPGTVDWLELTTEGGRTVWYVEVVSSDGVEWDVYVDSTTGEVVEVEED